VIVRPLAGQSVNWLTLRKKIFAAVSRLSSERMMTRLVLSPSMG